MAPIQGCSRYVQTERFAQKLPTLLETEIRWFFIEERNTDVVVSVAFDTGERTVALISLLPENQIYESYNGQIIQKMYGMKIEVKSVCFLSVFVYCWWQNWVLRIFITIISEVGVVYTKRAQYKKQVSKIFHLLFFSGG